jgi:hypothetical protein
VRTWDENRVAINQLWPKCEWTDEERKLMHDDLEPLDQAVLYDAIRNVKRNNDTLYPQLKWFRDEYRSLNRVKSLQERRPNPEREQRQVVRIEKRDDDKMAGELRAYIDGCTPGDWREAVDFIADKAASLKVEMATAFRLCRYLNERLGMAQGGRIS